MQEYAAFIPYFNLLGSFPVVNVSSCSLEKSRDQAVDRQVKITEKQAHAKCLDIK